MLATLASYGTALALDHAEHLGLGVVVLAVVLALTLSRTYHAHDWREWLLGIAVLSLLALAASEVGSLLLRHADIGDALFVLAISAGIWIRRFGPRFARAGTLITLPFVALLVAPVVPGVARQHLLWAAVVGAIAYVWVSAVRTIAVRTGVVAPPPPRPRPRPAAPAQGSRAPRRLVASTRMAIQMGAALALAFAVGRWLFGIHWSWLVMTAFIVSSGNRGRADVLYKSGLRIAGAALGTVAATLIVAQVAPGSATTVVVIFIVLGLASWLRYYSYAYWAAGITSVLALLYGYFGQSGTSVLAQRLEGIAVGAAIAIVVAWLLLPVRTSDVLRRRMADFLAAISELLTALPSGQPQLGAGAQFRHCLAALDEVAPPLHAHRFLARRISDRAHAADAIDAARRCAPPLEAIVEHAGTEPTALTRPEVEARRSRAAAKATAARRALVGRFEDDHAGAKAAPADKSIGRSELDAAFISLESGLTDVIDTYRAIAANG